MKKLTIALIVLLSVGTVLTADAGRRKKANRDTEQFRYDIEYANTGANNMLVVKVWSYSKNANIAHEQCSKNAIHGVIFKGYSSETGTISQRALVGDANAFAENQEFFDAFFADGGHYRKYVTVVGSGNREVKKVGNEYKVGVTVTVNKDQLRKDLESAGIIRGLTTGF